MPEETKTTKTTQTTTKKAAQPESTTTNEKFSQEYFQNLNIQLGNNGDKRRTDLDGNPINF